MKKLNQKHQDELNLLDVQLLQLCFMQNHELSASTAMFETCYSTLNKFEKYDTYRGKLFSINAIKQIDHCHPLITDSKAYTALNELIDGINTEWLKSSVLESYRAFTSMEIEEQLKIFGQCTALCAEKSFNRSGKDTIYNEVMLCTRFKKADHFTPTKDNYFGRINIKPLQKICSELFGVEWMKEREDMNRRTLAQEAENSYLKIKDQDFIPEFFYKHETDDNKVKIPVSY